MIYSHSGILGSNEKEESDTIRYNMDESHRCNARLKKKKCPIPKSIFIWFNFYEVREQAKLIKRGQRYVYVDQDENSSYLWGDTNERGHTREPTKVLETFYMSIWVVFTKVFLYIYLHIYKDSSESYSILPLTGFLTFKSFNLSECNFFPLKDRENAFDIGSMLRL